MNFVRRVFGSTDGSLLLCYPAFLKLKWKDGALFEAKSYLMAETVRLQA